VTTGGLMPFGAGSPLRQRPVRCITSELNPDADPFVSPL